MRQAQRIMRDLTQAPGKSREHSTSEVLVARIVSTSGARCHISFVDGNFECRTGWLKRNEISRKVEFPSKEMQRIIFYETDAPAKHSPVLLLDTIPDTTDFQTNPDPVELTVSVRIRCLLSKYDVGLRVVVRGRHAKDGDSVSYTAARLSCKAESGPDQNVAILGSGQSLRAALQAFKSQMGQTTAGHYTPPILEALGINLDKDVQFEVSFFESPDAPWRIQFNALSEYSTGQFYGPNALRQHVFDKRLEFTKNRNIIQRPFKDALDDSKIGLWLLAMSDVSGHADVDKAITQLCKSYHDAIRFVKAGHPVSFLPELTSIAGQKKWTVLYEIQDRIRTADPPRSSFVYVESASSARPGIEARSLSVQPQAALIIKCRFPLLHDQNGTSPTGTITTLPSPATTAAEDREDLFLPVATFAWDQNFSGRWLRIGALDLQLGGDHSSGQGTEYLLHFRNLLSQPSQERIPEIEVGLGLPLLRYAAGGQDAPKENSDSGDAEFSPDEIQGSFDRRCDQSIHNHFRREQPVVVELTGGAAQAGDFLLKAKELCQSGVDQTVFLELLSRKDYTPPAPAPSVTTSICAPLAQNRAVVIDKDPFMVALVEYPKAPAIASATIGTWSSERRSWELVDNKDGFCLVLPSQAIGEPMDKVGKFGLGVLESRLSPPAELQLNRSYFPKQFSEVPWNLRRLLGFGSTPPGTGLLKAHYELLYGLSCKLDYPFLRLAETLAIAGQIPGALPHRLTWQGTADQIRAFRQARLRWGQTFRQYMSRTAVFEARDEHQPDTLILNSNIACILRPAVTQNPIEMTGPGLPGGATWGFESATIYHEVQENPNSSSARLIDPYFSSLGGGGHQKVSFAKDKTSIYSDSDFGRTYSYTVERIGRIGVFWNLAKHVIVYNRSVLPSNQFPDNQKINGWPVLRKTDEYVEILQSTRTFPEERADPRLRGFVHSCSFPEGARYRVKSAWGSDVGTIGWKVPLWNATESAKSKKEETNLYPKPQVHLEVAAIENGDQTVSSVELEEPDNLFFYTDTRSSSTADTNSWPPIPDVDYSNIPNLLPADPKVAFQNGGTRPLTPPDTQVPAGYSLTTFKIVPSSIAVHLGHERTSGTMAAALTSVTMMRSSPVPFPSGQPPADQALDPFKQLDAQVAKLFAQLLQSAQQGITAFDPTQLKSSLADLHTQVSSLVTTATSKLEEQIKSRETELTSAFTAGVQRALAEVDDLKKEADDLIQNLSAENIDKLRAYLAHYSQLFIDELALVQSSPALLQRTAAAFIQQSSVIVATLQQASISISNAAKVSAKDAQDSVAALDTTLRQLVRTADLGSPETWIPTFPALFFSEFQGNRAAIEADILAQKDLTNSIKKLTTPPAWITNLDSAAKDFAQDWISEQQKKISGALETTLVQIKSTSNAAQCTAAVDAYRLAVQNITQIPGNLAAAFKNIQDQELALFKLLASTYKNHLDCVVGSLLDSGALADLLKGTVANAVAQLERYRDTFVTPAVQRMFDDTYKSFSRAIGNETVYQTAQSAIRLARAFGKPPELPDLKFDSPEIAYFYDEFDRNIGLSPVLARANQLQQGLNAIGIDLPSTQLLDNLIPADLKNFDLSKIFPDFAGIQLGHLFSGLKLPEVANKNVKVSHGVDKQSRKAWLTVNVDCPISEPATIFSFGPMALRLPKSNFLAEIQVEATAGQAPHRTMKGKLSGDWEVSFGSTSLVFFRETSLLFDADKGVSFDISPDKVEMAGALQFLSDMFKGLTSPDSGLTLGLLPEGGVQAVLNLPLPDIQGATFGIANLKLGALLALRIHDQLLDSATSPFSIALGFSLGRRETPFTLTIFVLGGAGAIDVQARYAPGSQQLLCLVSISLTASASLAVALGPIRGGVYVYFGVIVDFHYKTGSSSTFSIGIMLLIRGQVSVLGIVSACISLMLRAEYSNGKLLGRGQLSISIKICWCFSIEVHTEVSYQVGAGSGSARLNDPSEILLAYEPSEPGGSVSDVPVFAMPEPTVSDYVTEYLAMLVTPDED